MDLNSINNDFFIGSLQNGVNNTSYISSVLQNPVFPAVLYVAVEMSNNHTVKHHGRGDLVVGDISPASSPNDDSNRTHLHSIAQLFASGGIYCRISSSIRRDMWLKFLCNCSFNAISAIGKIKLNKSFNIDSILLYKGYVCI
jgi:2-dehydropantoate 2-reductase